MWGCVGEGCGVGVCGCWLLYGLVYGYGLVVGLVFVGWLCGFKVGF